MHAIHTIPFERPSVTLKDRAKLIIGAAVFPAQTRRWKNYVSGHPVLRELAPLFPRIVHKIYRPYLSNHFTCKERVSALVGHYTAVAEAGLGPIVRRAALEPVTLARFEGKGGAMIELRLSAISRAHREGELALHLVMDGRTVYTASFALLSNGAGRQVALGALQGLRAADGAALIKNATRALFGWRPKNFMVAAVRHAGDCLGCSDLLLVSNRNRITVNWRRGARISSDYDATWSELQARPRPDGNYELPCRPAAGPSLDQVPSHKRSEMRKRLALDEDVRAQLARALRP